MLAASRTPLSVGKISLFLALATSLLSANPDPEEVIRQMERMADRELSIFTEVPHPAGAHSTFFLGLLNLHQVSGVEKYQHAVENIGKNRQYTAGPDVTRADDHCALQAWLTLFARDGDMEKLRSAIDHFEKLQAELSKVSPKSISGGTFTWTSSNALLFSPPVWAQLSQLTGNPKYVNWADGEWWTTTDVLYHPQHRLFYQDNRFFTQKDPQGKPVFSSIANGRAAAGIVRILDHLPVNHPSRNKYLGQYKDMMHALAKLQPEDGLWKPSLLDSSDASGESAGTAWIIYSMAWGVNRGLLDKDRFLPTIIKGYEALVKNIRPEGQLGYVAQPNDEAKVPVVTADSSGIEGSGAFLLAGSEIVRHLDPAKREKGAIPFSDTKLPERFLREQPRVYARFVPERADDFAWENDLVAFRTYGPALRDKPENSGIDCWFKRVPSPVIDKWYIEDVTSLEPGKVAKSYHSDHGEGYDVYKVGDSRGCGGISVWVDGKLHNSETYISHRIIESTPEKVVFELHYASDLNGKTLRETKRITLIMGERFFQSDSKFTLDGEPAKGMEVAIGLMPQSPDGKADFKPQAGSMHLWENLDGHQLGTAVVIDPSLVTGMKSHTDAAGQRQELCLAKTDEHGSIRWFSGFAWSGQGLITTPEAWTKHLSEFAEKYVTSPFSDFSADASFQVHSLPVPGAN